MKKILYFGSMGYKSNRLDGVSVKSRCLCEYLKKQKIILKYVDVDNYKKNFISIIIYFIKYYFWCDKIIISSSSKGAYIMLKMLYYIKSKKDIYYFVAGGQLFHDINHGKYNIKIYKKIKKIYVQSKKMVINANYLKLKNVEFLNNFRDVGEFKSKYKKDKKIRFVFYGRIIKEKGIEQAIDLTKKLNEKNILCNLDIYGQVSDEYLKNIELLFDKNIKYKGFLIPDGKTEYETLSKYDILLFPTEWEGEGIPGTIIDSYFAGLAIIASNWKYAHECIMNKVNGIIFEYKNYEDMYKKTYNLIKNNEVAQYKKESLELSKKYYIENVLKNFIKELER